MMAPLASEIAVSAVELRSGPRRPEAGEWPDERAAKPIHPAWSSECEVMTTSQRSVLLSVSARRADLQIVATSETVALDLQARNYTADGRLQRQNALAVLSVEEARKVRDLLDQALSASENVADPRQTSLWSPATHTRKTGAGRRLS